jgi:hypothetical protein
LNTSLKKVSYINERSNTSNGNSILHRDIDQIYLLHSCSDILHKSNDINIKKSSIQSQLKGLSIDEKELKRLAKEKIDSIKIEDFKVGNQIEFKKSIPITFSDKTIWMKRTSVDAMCKANGMQLIQNKNRFRINKPEVFLQEKKASLTLQYNSQIEKLAKGIFYISRNDKNGRLDHNLTNVCSDFCKVIMEDNDLVSIDLNNSQFAILSYILKGKLSKEDLSLFKDKSISGMLYDYMKEELSLDKRGQAKTMMFELLFSSRRFSSENKDRVINLFPSVVEWIDAFKKEFGDKKFAIMLQQTESMMFIDNLYCLLMGRMDVHIPKHDAFMVKREDQELAMDIIMGYFKEIEMECTIEIEDGSSKTKVEVKPSPVVVVVKPMVKIETKFDSDSCFGEESAVDAGERSVIEARVKRIASQKNWKYLLDDIDEMMLLESFGEEHREIVKEAMIKFK